jgi:hypothetical protein
MPQVAGTSAPTLNLKVLTLSVLRPQLLLAAVSLLVDTGFNYEGLSSDSL